MEVLLANPRGFCAGVDRAVKVVEDLIELAGPPVYVRHEIVHNQVVVGDLASRGAVFVEDVADIPQGAVAVMSAHGVGLQVMEAARRRNLRVVDATCPLVTKVQLEVMRHARQGRAVVILGHRGHPEVDGLLGHYDNPRGDGVFVVETEREVEALEVPRPEAVAYVTQTTLAVDATRDLIEALRRRFPQIVDPHGETICYATQNRQEAVIRLAGRCDLVVVVGAPHSSNSRRLCEVAEEHGARAVLIERARDLAPAIVDGARRIGLTSSASAPEKIVEETLAWLRDRYPGLRVESMGEAETVTFRAPAALRAMKEEKAMTDTAVKPTPDAERERGGLGEALESLLDAARELAGQAREATATVTRLGERELAMILETAEDLRDRTVARERLEEARKIESLRRLRATSHRAVDLGFDAAAVGVSLGNDLLDTFLEKRPRRQTAQAA